MMGRRLFHSSSSTLASSSSSLSSSSASSLSSVANTWSLAASNHLPHHRAAASSATQSRRRVATPSPTRTNVIAKTASNNNNKNNSDSNNHSNSSNNNSASNFVKHAAVDDASLLTAVTARASLDERTLEAVALALQSPPSRQSTAVLQSAVLAAGDVELLEQLLHELRSRNRLDASLRSAFILAFHARFGLSARAAALFDESLKQNVELAESVYPVLIGAFGALRDVAGLRRVLAHGKQRFSQPHKLYASAILVSDYFLSCQIYVFFLLYTFSKKKKKRRSA